MTGLVEIAPPRFDVSLALAYATDDNVTGSRIYRRAACYLHREAAALLERAIELAAAQGLKLIVFDGYRPVEAQWVLWRQCPDPTFLADPRRGSPHSRGVAVDLSLADRETGIPLDMGTGFRRPDAARLPWQHGDNAGGPAQPDAAARPDGVGGLGSLSQRMVALSDVHTAPLSLALGLRRRHRTHEPMSAGRLLRAARAACIALAVAVTIAAGGGVG